MEDICDGAGGWIRSLRCGALGCYERVLGARTRSVRAGGDRAWISVTDIGFVIWVVFDTVEGAKEVNLVW